MARQVRARFFAKARRCKAELVGVPLAGEGAHLGEPRELGKTPEHERRPRAALPTLVGRQLQQGGERCARRVVVVLVKRGGSGLVQLALARTTPVAHAGGLFAHGDEGGIGGCEAVSEVPRVDEKRLVDRGLQRLLAVLQQ